MTDYSKNAMKAEPGEASYYALSPEQISNWRDILAASIGPYAYIMPDEEVESHRQAMQALADNSDIAAIETGL